MAKWHKTEATAESKAFTTKVIKMIQRKKRQMLNEWRNRTMMVPGAHSEPFKNTKLLRTLSLNDLEVRRLRHIRYQSSRPPDRKHTAVMQSEHPRHTREATGQGWPWDWSWRAPCHCHERTTVNTDWGEISMKFSDTKISNAENVSRHSKESHIWRGNLFYWKSKSKLNEKVKVCLKDTPWRTSQNKNEVTVKENRQCGKAERTGAGHGDGRGAPEALRGSSDSATDPQWCPEQPCPPDTS